MQVHTSKFLKGLLIVGMIGYPLIAMSGYHAYSMQSATLEKIDIQITDKNFIKLKAENRALAEVLQSIQEKSGIRFELSPGLSSNKLNLDISANSWRNALKTVLKDYNRIGFVGQDGRLKRVLVTGFSGDGVNPNSSSETVKSSLLEYPHNVLSQQPASIKYPEHLESLPAGSVTAIKLNVDALTNMAERETIYLSLPSGQYEVVHDNRVTHENGDITWVGYIEELGVDYRVIVTFGENGVFGRIFSLDGVYRIESNNESVWLVDVSAAGLRSGKLTGDARITLEMNDTHANQSLSDNGMLGFDPIGQPVLYPDQSTTDISVGQPQSFGPLQRRVTSASSESISNSAYSRTPADLTQIDLMVLYTSGMESGSAQTRINNLVAISNQAYIDSRVNIKLRLVHTEAVSYTNFNDNSSALSDLTEGNDGFSLVAGLRRQHGADLVSLIRPFDSDSHDGCGVAWLGGGEGSSFLSNYGFSVVGDGIDGYYYCTDYSLAHELGHNMGSNHDRNNTRYQGKYPYSFGYGIRNNFGTIMSYVSPEIGVFSNPDLDCRGQPCGVHENDVNSANNTLSLNNSSGTIAAFLAQVYPDNDNGSSDGEIAPDSDTDLDPDSSSDPLGDPEPNSNILKLGYDFNNDGYSDILWHKGKKVTLWLMRNGKRSSVIKIKAPNKKFTVATIGDFNGDDKPDILWRSKKGQNIITLMNGTKRISDQNISSALNQWTVLITGDFNGDSKADILWFNKQSKTYVGWLMDGAKRLSTGQISLGSPRWQFIGVGDFNGDGNTDIVWYDPDSSQIFISLMDGVSIFSVTVLSNIQKDWRVSALGDFDGNNSLDFLLRHRATGQLMTLLMDGGQLIGQQVIGIMEDRNWRIKGSGDFNSDGKSEIWWQERKGANSVMLTDGLNILGSLGQAKMKKWSPILN